MIHDVIALRDGLPIFTHTLDPKHGICQNEDRFTLISGFLQAITSFANTIDHLGEVDELQMTGLIFTFKKVQFVDSELLFIISSEGKKGKRYRKEVLDLIAENFIEIYAKKLKTNWNGDIKPFKNFQQVLVPLTYPIVEEYQDIAGEDSFEVNLPLKKESNKEEMDQNGFNVVLAQYQHKKAQINQLCQMQDQFKENNSDKNNFSDTFVMDHSSPIISQDNTEGFVNLPNLYAPPVPKRGNISSTLSDQKVEISHGSSIEISNPQDYNFQNGVLRPSASNPQLLTRMSNMHGSIYDLIPQKRILRAKDLQRHYQSDWIPVLLVCIDGQKSIREIAKLLNISEKEVFTLSRYLEQEEIIKFHRK